MLLISDKNDPSRFLGDGVSFRSKLIGVLEVSEARGDRMCQEALSDLKMAVRAAGEHKQRIVVHVAIDGLRLRDDKTGDSLYHHPVHKISFIAQDMTDSRAFGYIFGSPDTGHRFFGIKTDKTASQVVIAMRDLFQVVFELKKKEIELAKQQLEGKSSSGSTGRHSSGTTSDVKPKQSTEGACVAELVDLEQELSSLRRGLSQVERLTPAPVQHTTSYSTPNTASQDPFGDSFTEPPSCKGLLPPPPGRPRSASRPSTSSSPAPSDTTVSEKPNKIQQSSTYFPTSLPYDVFTELDPLGTGKNKPYIDKKNFFQELKNPPKKVLKDLIPTTQSSANLLGDLITCVATTKQDNLLTNTVTTCHSASNVSNSTSDRYAAVSFTLDPFVETDPFETGCPFTKDDPFHSSEFTFQKEIVSDKKTKFCRDSSVDKSDDSVPTGLRLQQNGFSNTSISATNTSLDMKVQSSPPPLPPKPGATESEYLTPTAPPLPGGRRRPQTSVDEPGELAAQLASLLSCGARQAAATLNLPERILARMTLPQLAACLRAHLNTNENNESDLNITKQECTMQQTEPTFEAKFEDNFAMSTDTFVADFDNLNKSSGPTFDRYAVFREIQDQELKVTIDNSQSVEPDEDDDDSSPKDMKNLPDIKKQESNSPLRTLDELAFDSVNMFKNNSVSPKATQIDCKIEDIKLVMKSMCIDEAKSSISPADGKKDEKSLSDRYAALRDISIVEIQNEEFESLPSDAPPKERKKSDERSDGFDNSDFFDCIDNSSLSFSHHIDDAFRKSPNVSKDMSGKETPKDTLARIDEGNVSTSPVQQCDTQIRLSTGSLSDIASGSSPEIVGKERESAWSALASSSDEAPAPAIPRPRRRQRSSRHTSSSSRDASPWEEERIRSRTSHHSRHNSSGSREFLDSGSGRDRPRDKYRRNSPADREHWHKRNRSPRDKREVRVLRDSKLRERDDYRRSRERDDRSYREDREHHRPRRTTRLSWDHNDEDNSSASGDRDYDDKWDSRSRRKDERNYGSLNFRESRRRVESSRQLDDTERRYAQTTRRRRRRSPPPPAATSVPKSESVDIFCRASDPFADDFFTCSASQRVARRERWPPH